MIIDAMDILYSGRCDGFVLVSSDSDFTRLATRLREAGMKVFGMGERKTPSPFIVACDKFVYIEVIRAAGEKARQQEAARTPKAAKPEPFRPEKTAGKRKAAESAPPESEPVHEPESQPRVPPEIEALIADSLDMIADEDGYAFMGELGNLLLKKQPDFDPRNFGFSKLTRLIQSMDRFEVDARQSGNSNTKHIYLRDKKGK
jgi:Fe-S-cluster formation regulator IscX/YfhJ